MPASIQETLAMEPERLKAPRRKRPADYHSLARQGGFSWLGPAVAHTGIKTGWACRHGHEWQTSFAQIRKGCGCPHCAGRRRRTAADYEALAHQRGFRWLGSEVPSTRTRTFWKCPQGHTWQARYISIHAGSGCPHCAGRRRKTPDDYCELARQRGFHWLGPAVSNNRMPTTWSCAQGHTWQAMYQSIAAGSSCPGCSAYSRKTAMDYHALARTRGLHWIGPEVPNSRTQTGWSCTQGHTWQSTYSRIRQGAACPTCHPPPAASR
jgi:hypothetical protein